MAKVKLSMNDYDLQIIQQLREIWKRIDEETENQPGKSLYGFCKEYGFDLTNLRNVRRSCATEGQIPIDSSFQLYLKLADYLGVNFNYLLHGTLPKEKENYNIQEINQKKIKKIWTNYNEDDYIGQMKAIWPNLSKKQKEAVLHTLLSNFEDQET